MFFTESSTTRSLLSFHSEPAPAFGEGRLDAKQDALYSMLAHVFPLLIYFWKRGDSPAVAAHGKEALNFALSLVLGVLPVSFVSAFLGSAVALVVSLLVTLVGLAALGLVGYAVWQCRQGRLFRYPLNLRLLK